MDNELSQFGTGVREGDVIAGKYRVEKVLGVGGMGVVVAARHVHLDEKVALKFLLPQTLQNREAVDRFLREARAAVKIKNENVARVTDVGTLENGAPYMVMEFLDGWDLSSLLRTRGAMPIDEAVDFLLQACVAVADAHALGIIHRDLKPANLFCVRRSDGQLCIKVLDFGISKLTDVTGNRASAMSMTKTDTVMGSPVYMSPEQMRSSKAVDTRTDIWSLGVVLFELIARRVPFTADSLMELGAKIATDPPPPLGSFRHDIPPGLEGVIFKCLEKDPRRRHANIGELAAALLPFAPSRAKASVERISGIIASAGALRTGADPSRPSHPMLMSTETLPSLGRTTSGATRGRSIAIGTSVLVVPLRAARVRSSRARVGTWKYAPEGVGA